jgi:methionyl-tRNA formyltransferase
MNTLKDIDLKIAMLGCAEVGFHIVRNLISEGLKFDYFVTLTKEQAVKYKVSGYIDFSNLANSNNIPIYYVKTYSLKDRDDIEFFKQKKFDLVILGGWQRLIPEEILKTLSIGAIGGHGSSNFLPKGRGRSPLNWSLIQNKKRFINHLILLKPGIDDGDILDYYQFDINEFDNIRTLYYKISLTSFEMLKKVLLNIKNGKLFKLEQKGEPTYYPKRTEEDGRIYFKTMSVDDIYNLVRAVTYPYPGAFCFVNNDNNNKLMIWDCKIFDRSIKYFDKEYGEVIEVFINGDFVVNCLDGLLLVTNYEPKIISKGDILF